VLKVVLIRKGARLRSMAKKRRKITTTRKQRVAAQPPAAKKEATTKSEKDDEGWGPIGDAAKKLAKGAVKGAAKEISK